MNHLDLLYGLIRLPWWGYVLVSFVTIQLMFLGITLFLHREQSHGGLELHPALRHFFRFWLWFSSGTVTKQWVAVHRKHHAFADQHGDPHSPVIFGIRKVLLEGYELYVAASRNPELLENYGRGTPDDWLERNLYSKYSVWGLVGFIALQLVLFGVPAIIMAAVLIAAQPFFAAGVINGLGHWLGYRSFEMPSAARNIVPWGLIVAGEELHNNHHAFPWSARFAVQRWEVDVGWMWICVFRAVGLARVLRVAPQPHLSRQRQTLDSETFNALFTNRMHVLRDYGKRVVRPVCRELKRREPPGSVPASAPKLLVRHPMLLADEARGALKDLLQRHEVLRAVFDFRERLQQVWNDTNQARALAQLRELCAQAEASGIRALRDFAHRLRAYAPGPV
jgi:stearoyl-CoA desaturase (delta-9 desaturase)